MLRVRAAVAGHVGLIAAEDQRSLFQLRVGADYEFALSLFNFQTTNILSKASELTKTYENNA